MQKLLLVLCLCGLMSAARAQPSDSLRRAWASLQTQPPGHARDTARAQTLKAIMLAWQNMNLDSSLHYAERLIGCCQTADLSAQLVYAYQFAGYLYQIKGDYRQSIHLNYKALALAENQNLYDRIAAARSALAHAYTSLKEYTKAIECCQLGLAVLDKHPYPNARLATLSVLGAVYREQGKLDKSLTVNQEMYDLARSQGDRWYESQGLHAIGWVCMEQGKLPQAMAYFDKALTLARALASVDLEQSILLHIADVQLRQRHWRQALTYCLLAKKTATRVKNSGILAEAEEKLYTIYKQLGQPANALAAYENFVSLRDSLSKEKNQQKIETLEAQYKSQKQQVQLLARKNENQQLAQTRNGLLGGMVAALLVLGLVAWNNRRLQAKNREIDRQRTLLETARTQLADNNKTLEIRVSERTAELLTANAALTRKNEEIKKALYTGQTIERKRVALELHDNLSSLLTAVNMTMQSIDPQHLSESEQSVYRTVRQLVQHAYAEVRNISHNILPAELDREGLAATLTTLMGRLNQSATMHFVLTISGLAERLPVEIEFNVYSIVLELLNNAIKHAQASTVRIGLFRTDTGLDVAVTDDGVGLGGQADKRGVGLQNILTRLESLGGTFATDRPTDPGTRIHIKIPIETVRPDGNVLVS